MAIEVSVETWGGFRQLVPMQLVYFCTLLYSCTPKVCFMMLALLVFLLQSASPEISKPLGRKPSKRGDHDLFIQPEVLVNMVMVYSP